MRVHRFCLAVACALATAGGAVAGDISVRTQEKTDTVPNQAGAVAIEVSCSAGELATGGGFELPDTDRFRPFLKIKSSRPKAGDESTWVVSVSNRTGRALDVTAFVKCLRMTVAD